MAQKNSPARTLNPRGLKRVLAARFSALGDVAMAIPVLYSAARCYPDIRFYFLTRTPLTDLFINCPDNLVPVGVDLKKKYKGATAIWHLFNDLYKEYRFDAFVDLHDVIRTKLFRFFCRLRGIPVRVINKGRSGKRALTRKRNKIMLPMISSRARYREVFYSMGLPLETRFDGLFGKDGAPSQMIPDYIEPLADGGRRIAIAPFAAHRGKIYPPELMEKVVAELAADPRNRIIFFGGGADEEAILNDWTARYAGCISLAGRKAGFSTELAIMSRCDVMISMDSGNMHLASLVNLPVVSVWGATHPFCGFNGWHQHEQNIVQLPLTCRPCSVFGDKPCYRGDYLCLSGITPQMILNKVNALLK